MTIKLTWEEWVEQYKPIKNSLNPDACYDGYMFETYDEEWDFVTKEEYTNRRWTLVEDSEGSCICEGMHIVNRLGYFITEVPIPEGVQFTVDEEIYDEDEEE